VAGDPARKVVTSAPVKSARLNSSASRRDAARQVRGRVLPCIAVCVMWLAPGSESRASAQRESIAPAAIAAEQSDGAQVQEAATFGFSVGLAVAAVVVVSRKRRL
jgi:hypothetical protein